MPAVMPSHCRRVGLARAAYAEELQENRSTLISTTIVLRIASQRTEASLSSGGDSVRKTLVDLSRLVIDHCSRDFPVDVVASRFSLIALDHSQHGLASVGRHTHAPLIGAVFEPVMVGGRQVKPNCLQCPSGHDSPFVGLFSRRLPNSHGSFFLSLLSRQLPNGHRSCFVGLPTRQVPNGNDLNSLGAFSE